MTSDINLDEDREPETGLGGARPAIQGAHEGSLLDTPLAAAADDKPEDDQAINPADIRVAAMNFLARREHSLRELRQKLGKRFADENLVNIELQRLVEERLQCDERYAEAYVRQRSGKGFGPVRVRQELRERGLDDSVVSQAMSCTDIDWFAQAEEAYGKKFGSDVADDIKEKAKRIRFMEYRGYTSEHFQHLLEDRRI